MQRLVLVLAGLCGSAAVLLAAFAAHGLDQVIDRVHPAGGLSAEEARSFFETGLRNLMYHALCLGVLGCAWLRLNRFLRPLAFLAIVAGVVLFSGGLMWRAVGGPEQVVPLVPLGGISYAAGWFLMALAALLGPSGADSKPSAEP